MARHHEMVLGFDARELFLDANQQWPMARRERYLIRKDLAKPLSVDWTVWPSIFTPIDARPGVPDPLNPSIWRGPLEPWWQSLRDLRNRLPKIMQLHHVLVAGTVIAPPGVARRARATWEDATHGVVPKVLPASWRPIGYDVADASFVSGLTNCGYDETDSAPYRWADDLNEYHLFSSIEPAIAFARYSDIRVSEHAPFYVYGIYVHAKRTSVERERRTGRK